MHSHLPSHQPTTRVRRKGAASQLASVDAGDEGLPPSSPPQQTATMGGRLVPIGSVLRPHGLMGEMVVYPYLNDLGYYGQVREVGTFHEGERVRWHRVHHARVVGDRILLQLVGCRSMSALPSLIGQDLHVPRTELPPPGEGEFYWFDLEGLSAYTDEGHFLGRVTDFFPTGSNEVLVVRDGPREILIPFIGEVILAVDETKGCLRIRALPGLL